MDLTQALLDEGVLPEDIKLDLYPTYVFDEGFFTMRIDNGLPAIVHFCVFKEKRSAQSARALAKHFKDTVRGWGFQQAYLHSKKDYIDRMIQYYFKTKPFAEKDGYRFYKVKVEA